MHVILIKLRRNDTERRTFQSGETEFPRGSSCSGISFREKEKEIVGTINEHGKGSSYLLHKCRMTSVDLNPSKVYSRLANRRTDGRSTDLLTVSEVTGAKEETKCDYK